MVTNDYPETPFDDIAFSLSGGGFRAAAYGLGVISLLHYIRLDAHHDAEEPTLLHKVRFMSSASGGTFTLLLYAAALRKGISFEAYYHHLNQQISGEVLLQEAIRILKADDEWKEAGKTRNLINAFAKAYHQQLLSFMGEEDTRILASLMAPAMQVATSQHLQEVCFNATDFYSGLSFRFQVGVSGEDTHPGRFGNNSISLNVSTEVPGSSMEIISKIRLADVLAASSCFPIGFEPIVFPNDFLYPSGPSAPELKQALYLRTYSWDDRKTAAENALSTRAPKEKAFVDNGVFGLMDGGICDNQGIYSMILANERRIRNDHKGFDLMMVSDVSSYLMTPFKIPEVQTNQPWMKQSPDYYFQKVTHWWWLVKDRGNFVLSVVILLALLMMVPVFIEGPRLSSIMLLVIGLGQLAAAIYAGRVFRRFRDKNILVEKVLEKKDLYDVITSQWPPEKNFTNNMVGKVTEYMQHVQLGPILQMLNARLQSAISMTSDVFLKQVRRLIYDEFYDDRSFRFKRISSLIYTLTYTNDKRRRTRKPTLDSSDTTPEKKAAFLKEAARHLAVTPALQSAAELAYSTGTTLWFEVKPDAPPNKDKRRAVVACGQFTTCFRLLEYALALKYTRYFDSLESRYQKRIELMIGQLAPLADAFREDPYYLYEKMEKGQ